MAFPSTISGLIEPYHGIGGPFVNSLGTVYVVTRSPDTVGIQIFKAADPAASWSGAASLNMTSGNTVRALNAYQVGDIMHIATRDAGTTANNQVRYHTYNMLTDAFVISNQLVKTTYTQAGTIDESPVGIVVRSGGAVIVSYEGPQVLADIQRARTYYARHLGAAWSADIALDNGGNFHWYPTETILGSGNRVHFFLATNDNDFFQRTLNSANALETFPTAFDTSLVAGLDDGLQRGIAYSASAGGTVVRLAYLNDIDVPSLADVRFTSADAPTPLTVTTDITGTTDPLVSNIRRVVSLAKDDATIYATFVGGTAATLTFDNAGSTATAVAAMSCGLDLTATANAVLLVFTNVGSPENISAVHIGSTQLTRLGAVDYRTFAPMRAELWALTAPPSGVLAISAELVDTADPTEMGMAAITYTGHRTSSTPFGTVFTATAESALISTLTASAATGNTVVFGFNFEEPLISSVGAALTNRAATTGAFPAIIIAEAPGATSVIGSVSINSANYFGNIGVNIIATSGATGGVYLMSSQDAGSWSTPTLLQAASGIHVWSNCYVRNSTRVLAVLYNESGTIKYTEYSLSAAASASQFAARLGLLGVGR